MPRPPQQNFPESSRLLGAHLRAWVVGSRKLPGRPCKSTATRAPGDPADPPSAGEQAKTHVRPFLSESSVRAGAAQEPQTVTAKATRETKPGTRVQSPQLAARPPPRSAGQPRAPRAGDILPWPLLPLRSAPAAAGSATSQRRWRRCPGSRLARVPSLHAPANRRPAAGAAPTGQAARDNAIVDKLASKRGAG